LKEKIKPYVMRAQTGYVGGETGFSRNKGRCKIWRGEVKGGGGRQNSPERRGGNETPKQHGCCRKGDLTRIKGDFWETQKGKSCESTMCTQRGILFSQFKGESLCAHASSKARGEENFKRAAVQQKVEASNEQFGIGSESAKSNKKTQPSARDRIGGELWCKKERRVETR